MDEHLFKILSPVVRGGLVREEGADLLRYADRLDLGDLRRSQKNLVAVLVFFSDMQGVSRLHHEQELVLARLIDVGEEHPGSLELLSAVKFFLRGAYELPVVFCAGHHRSQARGCDE